MDRSVRDKIDLFVGEQVMGFVTNPNSPDFYRAPKSTAFSQWSNWHPSTYMEEAFQVVNKMRELGYNFILQSPVEDKEIGSDHWNASFYKVKDLDAEKVCRMMGADEETAELAICRAALKAIQEGEKEEIAKEKKDDGQQSLFETI